ncbi:MAG TPA: fibronectin type III domain-containing protein [Actinomycetota bacterium]|nr:fibronectin type III domain-containing protein [Actinomycetota bacterium]
MKATLRRATILPVLVIAMVAGTLTTPASAAAPPVSPVDRVVIVTANLLEGFDPADLRNMGEMDVFADRVLNVIGWRPDVLLLQEVNSKSSRYVANSFSRKTGQTYAVVADAGDKAYRETDTRVIKRDMSIVINTATMSKAGTSGYIVTKYARPGSKVEYKYNARALVSEDRGTLRLGMVSTHVPGANITKTSQVMATKLDNAYPSTSASQFEILGGDFNQVGLNYVDYGQVKTHPFWDALTKTFGYVDSGYNVYESKFVDYVFVRGGVWGAGVDAAYNPKTARGTKGFYSDHQFRWAVVGPDEVLPATPGNVSIYARRTDSARVKVTWSQATDNAGIAAYDLYRSTNGSDFSKVGTTDNLTYYDSNVTRGTHYWYRVVARDWSNNRSPASVIVDEEA